MRGVKFGLLLAFAGLVAAFFLFDLDTYLSLDSLQSRQAELRSWHAAHPWISLLAFAGVYVLVTGLSLPGATILGLAAGALFGFWQGTILVSFASTMGATVAFLVGRFLLRDLVQQRFSERLKIVNQGVRRDGAFYLFTLRLIPLFPFFVINLLMALTPMRAWTFAWVSQVGMLAGTAVYVNAGTQLAGVDSVTGILSAELIGSFALLGIFPWVARKLVAILRRRRALARWPRPRRFDYNLLVIGGGAAGLVAAYIAAALKAKVALVERDRMGGDCLYTGCVPSKTLIASARLLARMRRAEEFGLRVTEPEVDFPAVMRRVRDVVGRIAPHDSAERYTRLGVDCIQGDARILSPYSVRVGDRELTARNIILASGARPWVPELEGSEGLDILTSDNLWGLERLPGRLLVLGGGPIGCELAQAFARLGSRVTLVEMASQLLPREDADMAQRIEQILVREGIGLHLEHRALRIDQGEAGHELVCEHAGTERRLGFERILVALGRRAETRGLGLQELGVVIGRDGTVEHDRQMRTALPNLYVCGDVAGPFQFTHMAAHQAWYATVNALFGRFWSFAVDETVVPFATFVDPELARVGLSEQEAQRKGIAYETVRYELAGLDRALAEGEAQGVVRVLTVPGKDRILGASILAHGAGELIGEFVSAMRNGYGLNKIMGTIHVYPTMSEANKHAASAWRRAHAPQRLLRWVERYHAWTRKT